MLGDILSSYSFVLPFRSYFLHVLVFTSNAEFVYMATCLMPILLVKSPEIVVDKCTMVLDKCTITCIESSFVIGINRDLFSKKNVSG